MKKIITIVLLCYCQVTFSQTTVLSESAKISVVTMGPSQEELYSAFGHSGIRVYDSIAKIDAFFNYGIFDFNRPYFYLNFARGYLYYMVDAYDYSYNVEYYTEHHR